MASSADRHQRLAEFREREQRLLDALRTLIGELEKQEGQPFVQSLSQSLVQLEQLIAADAARREKAVCGAMIRSLSRPFADEFYGASPIFDLWGHVLAESWLYQEARYAKIVE